jgi:cellulose synthase/poly-beta-1,6-N-acetylglucosamine synthase-like glycosyltransferase
MLIDILFWIFVFFIFHSYILYPLILKYLSSNKKINHILFQEDDQNLPYISVILAAYNEEEVIERKILSIVETSYPNKKIEILIGSDNSDDATNQIIDHFCKKYPGIKPYYFEDRQGKAKIINRLAGEARGSILVMTDANVFFTPSTLYELIKHFKNQQISIVGGNIINTNLKNTGISVQEKTYLYNENAIKYNEGLLWGAMIGAFGGVYAIRKDAYRPVPLNYFMDDFYITMSVLKDKKKAIMNLDATAIEDVSNVLYEEFRRKIRISIGNFQNLSSFYKLALNPFKPVGFAFISHKILRWFTPFFLLACLILSAFLAFENDVFKFIFLIQLIFYTIPLIDFLLRKINLHIVILRFITHFVSMNVALLAGFIKYLKGVNTNVWQPTKRNQQ